MKKDVFEKLKKLADKITVSTDKTYAERVRIPQLPAQGPLTKQQQWTSILWSIDSAEKHGEFALRGLALAFSNIIQADLLATLVMDAREQAQPHSDTSFMLWDQELPLTEKSERLKDLLLNENLSEPVNLSQSVLLSAPWQRYRLFRALENLGKNPWLQNNNHCGTVWRHSQ